MSGGFKGALYPTRSLPAISTPSEHAARFLAPACSQLPFWTYATPSAYILPSKLPVKERELLLQRQQQADEDAVYQYHHALVEPVENPGRWVMCRL